MKKSDESMLNQNHYYNKGNNTEIAFVFSVPGKLELYNNRPIVGETGVLLEDLMLLLKEEVFAYYDETKKTNRYDYRITNSWIEPLFKAKDNKTEAANKEIVVDENIIRLQKELEDITDYIFVFGKKAELAVKKLELIANKVIFTRHLGLMSMNQIKLDINKEKIVKGGNDNTMKRLIVITQEIKEKLTK